MKANRLIVSIAIVALLTACNNDKPAKPTAINPHDDPALRPFHGFNLPPISNFDTPPKEAKK